MLRISWTWRIKSVKAEPNKDFKALTDMGWTRLDEEIAKNFAAHDSANPIPQVIGKEETHAIVSQG